MLVVPFFAPLLALPVLGAPNPDPNPDFMDLWPTRLVPTGTEPTTMTYVFNFPFPTTVTKVWNEGAAAVTAAADSGSGSGSGSDSGGGGSGGKPGVTSGTALAAAAATTAAFNPLAAFDPNAMSGAIAAAFQQQADALLAEVKKQTIMIVCAIVFGTLGGIGVLAGLIWCMCRRRKNRKARQVGPPRTHIRLDSESDVAVGGEKGRGAV